MKQFYLLLTILLLCSLSRAEIIQIGTGQVEDKGLPWSVTSGYSYVQQVYPAAAILVSGSISSIGFQYNVSSNVFLAANNELRVFLGHTSQTSLETWIPFSELIEVFNGSLQYSDFSNGLPGSGWLTIVLETPFVYNNGLNLVIAIDENSSGYGASNDDFFCSLQEQNRALRFRSGTINPDPANPPSSSLSALPYLANLRLDISSEPYTPRSPLPADQAVEVSLQSGLSWQSGAGTFDLRLGNNPDNLPLVAQNLSVTHWQPAQNWTAGHYFWQVTAHQEGEVYPGSIWQFSTVGTAISAPRELSASFTGNAVNLYWLAPLNGLAELYRIYRDGALIGSTGNCSYQDTHISPLTSYMYQVQAVDAQSQLSPLSAPVQITTPQIDPNLVLQESFEFYLAFTQNLYPWQNLNLDSGPSWSLGDYYFPGVGSSLGWLVFCPQETVPPMNLPAHTGTKMLCSISSMSPPSNDWLISPMVNLGVNPSISFYARSLTSDYGLERLRVLVSNGSEEPADFIPVSPEPYLSVPVDWTHYSYNLNTWQGQNVRFAFQALSWDAALLLLDDIELRGEGASSNSEDIPQKPVFSLMPNPGINNFRLETESSTEYLLEIYDLRGRLLYRGKNRGAIDSRSLGVQLRSGLHFIRIYQNGTPQTLRYIHLHD